MTSKFEEYVSKYRVAKPLLPVTHTCDGLHFRGIYEDRKILLSKSDDFGELIAYFFYGRPAFRPSSWGDKSVPSTSPFLPCSFIIESASLVNTKRIYPFDSGAWDRICTQPFMHPELERDNFLMNPFLDLAARVVNRFFGTNNKYYNGKHRNITIPPLQFEAQSYHELTKLKSTKSLDDRIATIEIQSETDLELDNNVLFVVLPNTFYSNPRVRHTIDKEWSTVAGVYDVESITPQEHMGFVVKTVKDFLETKGYI